MGFRDDREAQRGRIASLEGELEEKEAALEAARAEIERLKQPPPPPQYGENDPVWIRWYGSWYRGHVLRVEGDRFYVTYTGYSSRWNESVTADRLAPGNAAPPADKAIPRVVVIVGALLVAAAVVWWLAADSVGAPEGVPVRDLAELQVGQRVEVLSNGTWYDAEVIAPPSGGLVMIHYDGYASSWDELVGPERIRR